MVLEHNKVSADTWSESGPGYELISFGVSDALARAVQLLWPQPDEKILEIATGTGWCARNISSFGARITAVDIADELLASAKLRSAQIKPTIKYLHGDAEELPFEDEEFDGVISTFGVMFAADHAAASAELGRVCRPGGRLVLATWAHGPDSLVARMFKLVAKHAGVSPPEKSPLDWGKADYLRRMLGKYYDLEVLEGISTSFAPNGDEVWRLFYEGFGPVRILADRIDADSLAAFRRDFVSLHEEYRSGDRLNIERKYVLTLGKRK